jgi:hypothetical protein
MRGLALKEESLIDGIWTAVEQWDACDGRGEGSGKKCENCPFQIFYYDAMHGSEFYQCLKMIIEQIHEEVCT